MATAPAPDPILLAGQYLARRREAAGLARRDLALIYAAGPGPIGAVSAELLIAAIEEGRHLASDAVLDRFRAAYAFERYIYRCLAESLPTPPICRGCGCSWTDPCVDSKGGPCAWSGDPSLCTRCAGPRAVRA